jgi:hypothetical protein
MSWVTAGGDNINNVARFQPGQHMASPRFALGRILVLAASAAGVVAAMAVLALSWPAPPESFMARLTESAGIVTCLLVLGMTLLIGWRAGDHAPNIAIALSLTFIYGGIVVSLLCDRLQVVPHVRQFMQLLMFLLGSAFYIRSTQLFPRKLTAADIAASPTTWGHVKPLQAGAIALLHPAAAWGIAATATAALLVSPSAQTFFPLWMCITATGILFFYITFRGADLEARHKVLWFFEAALAATVVTIFSGALELALGESLTPYGRSVMQLVFSIVSGLAMVVCFAAAVFYAGAFSPALIVRKTLVYGATVTLLLFLFAVGEIYIAHSLIHALHVNDRFASAILGAIFGLAFHPLKHRIEHFLKRFAPKDKAGATPAPAASPAVTSR